MEAFCTEPHTDQCVLTWNLYHRHPWSVLIKINGEHFPAVGQVSSSHRETRSVINCYSAAPILHSCIQTTFWRREFRFLPEFCCNDDCCQDEQRGDGHGDVELRVHCNTHTHTHAVTNRRLWPCLIVSWTTEEIVCFFKSQLRSVMCKNLASNFNNDPVTSSVYFAVLTTTNSSLWVMRTLLGIPHHRHGQLHTAGCQPSPQWQLIPWRTPGVCVGSHGRQLKATLFRNPSCASPDAHLPQASSPLSPSFHSPLPPCPWTPVLHVGDECLDQDKARPLAWRSSPPPGFHACAGGHFPGWRGNGRSHPPAAAWDPTPPPTAGWVWPGPWRTAGLTVCPPAPRPHLHPGYRWRAVSPEQPRGGRGWQWVLWQERWSWK